MSSNLYKAVRRVWRVVEYSKARRHVQTGNRFSRGCVSVMSASGGGRSDEPAARLRCRCGCADAGWLRNSWWARACAGTRYRRPTARGGARHWSAAPRGRPDTPQRTAARAPADPRRSDLYDQRATVGDGPSRAFWDLLGGPADRALPGFWPLTGGHDGQQRRHRQRARPPAERHRVGSAVLLAVVGDR